MTQLPVSQLVKKKIEDKSEKKEIAELTELSRNHVEKYKEMMVNMLRTDPEKAYRFFNETNKNPKADKIKDEIVEAFSKFVVKDEFVERIKEIIPQVVEDIGKRNPDSIFRGKDLGSRMLSKFYDVHVKSAVESSVLELAKSGSKDGLLNQLESDIRQSQTYSDLKEIFKVIKTEVDKADLKDAKTMKPMPGDFIASNVFLLRCVNSVLLIKGGDKGKEMSRAIAEDLKKHSENVIKIGNALGI